MHRPRLKARPPGAGRIKRFLDPFSIPCNFGPSKSQRSQGPKGSRRYVLLGMAIPRVPRDDAVWYVSTGQASCVDLPRLLPRPLPLPLPTPPDNENLWLSGIRRGNYAHTLVGETKPASERQSGSESRRVASRSRRATPSTPGSKRRTRHGQPTLTGWNPAQSRPPCPHTSLHTA